MTFDEAALWQVYVDALDRRPDSRMIDEPDWMQLVTPGSKLAPHNKVLRARLEASAVAERAAEVLAEHRARGAIFGWAVGHRSSPADLSERLDAAGIPCRSVMLGMVRAVRGKRFPCPAGVTVRPAQVGEAEAIADVGARAWGRSARFREAVRQATARSLAEPSRGLSHLVAEVDGELVASSTLRILPRGLGYMQGAWVLPAYRGRGIYTALTQARLDALDEKGIPQVCIWANETTAAPIAKRMGFVEVARGAYHDSDA